MMLNIRHLPKAPIVEALLDIRVRPTAEFDVEHLRGIAPILESEYDAPLEKHQGEFQIMINDLNAGPSANAQMKSANTGFVFHGSQKSKILQLTKDGFTQNFLPPYSNGDLLFEEARKNWAHYVVHAKPQVATRLAMRYINKVHIAGDQIDFDDSLAACPQIPDSLPQFLANFFSRVTIANPKISAFAAVTQAFSGEQGPTGIDVVLDIDVFSEGEFDVSGSEMWDRLKELRVFKNEIFFGFVKEGKLEDYK